MAGAVRVAGTAFVKVDGGQIPLRGTLTIQPLDTDRSGMAGTDGLHGVSEKSVFPFIEVEFTKDPTVSVKQLGAIKNSTVTGECADGAVYVLRNAWQSGTIELDAGEGKGKVKFEGLSCNEF